MNSLSNLELARHKMIEQQIRPWDVLDMEILALLSTVRREDFVPVAHQALAFVDMELPLDEGQCMLSPRVEARMLQDLHVKKTDRVLEIGAGSGYMAALLGQRAAQVISLEIKPALVEFARENLRDAGVANVEVRLGDGSRDVFGLGDFDVIVLSGSVPQVPEDLLSLLKPGGRLGAIVGEEPMMRTHLVKRLADSRFETTQPWDTVAPRLLNFRPTSSFTF